MAKIGEITVFSLYQKLYQFLGKYEKISLRKIEEPKNNEMTIFGVFLWLFSAKARKFKLPVFVFSRLIGGDHDYGHEKSFKWTIKGIHVDFPEQY